MIIVSLWVCHLVACLKKWWNEKQTYYSKSPQVIGDFSKKSRHNKLQT